MKILYLSHRIPYPPNKGDKIRSFNELKFLSKDHEIFLCALYDEKYDSVYEKKLLEYSKICYLEYLPHTKRIFSLFKSLLNSLPISVNYFYSSNLQKKIDKLIHYVKFDAVFCFCSVMAEYVFNTKFINNPLLIVDYCDLDSEKWRQYSVNSSYLSKLIYKYEAWRLLEYEKKVNHEFNKSIFISDTEKELFLSKYKEARDIHIISNGIDCNFYKSDYNRNNDYSDRLREKFKNKKIILFVGAMDYRPNIEGILWFTKKVFKKIKKSYPDACLLIVGSKPAHEVNALNNQEDIFVTGFVEDVRPYYNIAHIVVVPLFIARGIQNKVLEAMAMEKSVVLTEEANQGIGGDNGVHLLTANNVREFCKSVSLLLTREDMRAEMGKKARSLVTENFSWKSHLSNINSLLSLPGKQ